MGCINHTYPPVIRAFLLAAALLIFGCAGEQNAVQKDPFFEKWSTMAIQLPAIRRLRVGILRPSPGSS